jgi:superfamily II DNA or RNA helicase
MHRTERREILQRFAQGQLDAITAPRVLDEGIDVPEADLAIIFATSKTRRQMVQRMGRVLRRKADGRFARFIVLYVEGTTEDPAVGAHESFIGEIADRTVAEEVRTFDSRSSSSAIVNFLNDFAVPSGQPPARMADE